MNNEVLYLNIPVPKSISKNIDDLLVKANTDKYSKNLVIKKASTLSNFVTGYTTKSKSELIFKSLK